MDRLSTENKKHQDFRSQFSGDNYCFINRSSGQSTCSPVPSPEFKSCLEDFQVGKTLRVLRSVTFKRGLHVKFKMTKSKGLSKRVYLQGVPKICQVTQPKLGYP